MDSICHIPYEIILVRDDVAQTQPCIQMERSCYMDTKGYVNLNTWLRMNHVIPYEEVASYGI